MGKLGSPWQPLFVRVVDSMLRSWDEEYDYLPVAHIQVIIALECATCMIQASPKRLLDFQVSFAVSDSPMSSLDWSEYSMMILVTFTVIQSMAICAFSGLLNLNGSSIRLVQGSWRTFLYLSYLIHIPAHAHNQNVSTHGADELRKLCTNTLAWVVSTIQYCWVSA